MPPPDWCTKAASLIAPKIDSMESSTGSTKQAESCCRSRPAFMRVGEFGRNSSSAIMLEEFRRRGLQRRPRHRSSRSAWAMFSATRASMSAADLEGLPASVPLEIALLQHLLCARREPSFQLFGRRLDLRRRHRIPSFAELLQLALELFNTFELAVDGRETDVRHQVDILQTLEHHLYPGARTSPRSPPARAAHPRYPPPDLPAE